MTGETSQTSLLEGGGPPQRWKEFEPIAFTPNIFFFQHIGHMKHMKHMKHKSRFSERRRILMGAGIATVGCICNCWLHRRIPFVSGVIQTIFREGARRVIGATAKPLYVIDRKTEGFVGRVTLWETIA